MFIGDLLYTTLFEKQSAEETRTLATLFHNNIEICFITARVSNINQFQFFKGSRRLPCVIYSFNNTLVTIKEA